MKNKYHPIRKQKRYSLKGHVFFILTGFAAAVLVMTLFNGISSFRGYSQLNIVYQLLQIYNAYGSETDTLQDMTDSFVFSPSEDYREALLQQATLLEDYAKQMETLAGNAQFTNLRNLTLAYTSKVRELSDHEHDSETEQLGETLSHMNELLHIQYAIIEDDVNDFVDECMVANRSIWKTQLAASFLFSASILVYAGFAVVHLSENVILPLSRITQQLLAWQQNDASVRNESSMSYSITTPEQASTNPDTFSCYPELQIMNQAYLDMQSTISAQVEELKDKIRISEELRKKEKSLAAAELGLMQSLINPHFLYNSLSTVSSLATIEQAPRTSKCAVMIASFLRKSLNSIGQQVTIWEEVNYTSQYIEIQKLRYGETITFSIFCEPECAEIKIPAILLQPLIENAIQHGVKSMRNGAKISVTIRKEADFLKMLVTDNGKGISEEKLLTLRTMLQSDYEPNNKDIGVGLQSVSYRLRSLYAGQARITLESRPGNTQILLWIPCKANAS